ncbi:MAG TPA: hypothetical protein VI854_01975, partial [Acidimicrobiia bacterium]|nr:hypothetical protein [Acidimicrobiia bacterium]
MARDGARWKARPKVAFLVRLLALLIPAVAGSVAAWAMAEALPAPSDTGSKVFWWGAVIAAAVCAVLVTERLARRLLPLAWLLTLNLAFPDRAPSRMVVARRAARRRNVPEALHVARRRGLGED